MTNINKKRKILVIIDTNNLGNYSNKGLSCKNYSFLEINKHLHQNIVKNFNYEKNTKIQLAIPELVLDEILNQQIACFKEDISKLNIVWSKFSKLDGFKLNIKELDYNSYLKTKRNSYLEVYNIIKINNPQENIFPKLINKVLAKEKPFYKKNNTDSGFKDAIIWEAINEFIKDNSYDKYFFLTNDMDFKDENLQKEFFANSRGKNLIVVQNVSELKGMLEEEIKGTYEINNSLKIIESGLDKDLSNIFKTNFIEVGTEESVFKVTDLLHYEIVDIDFEDNLYELILTLTIEHNTPYTGYGFIDDSFIPYEKEIRHIELCATFDKNHKLKEIYSESLLFNREDSRLIIS